MNYKLTISFDGSNYHGWQRQLNDITVAACMENAVMRIFGEYTTVNGCSRTDAGVHALEYCCNFRSQKQFSPEKLIASLNSQLPKDICVNRCELVPEEFHARFDCKSKEYVYVLLNSKTNSPFLINRAYFYPYMVDVELMNTVSGEFVGTHDFASFCASGSSVSSTVRTVESFKVERRGELVTFCVTADGFLYNMVRIMVGTLLDISRGKIGPGALGGILEAKDRTLAGITAPAAGLYLAHVYY